MQIKTNITPNSHTTASCEKIWWHRNREDNSKSELTSQSSFSSLVRISTEQQTLVHQSAHSCGEMKGLNMAEFDGIPLLTEYAGKGWHKKT